MNEQTLLEVALDCAGRGWHVFPCVPRGKAPATRQGFKDATTDAEQIRAWWAKNPAFNVGIACGVSGLCVVDCDFGLDGSPERFADFTKRLGLAETYAVRTGRRPGYGLQLYCNGAIPDSKFEVHGELATYTGDVKSSGGYVMAAGSVHPSGEAYELVADERLQATPEAVRTLKRQQPKASLSGKIESDRNSELTRRAGLLRNSGMSEDMLRETLHRMNEVDCTEPLPDAEVDRIADNASKWAMPDEDVPVTIGIGRADAESSVPVDWRTRYMTAEAYRSVKPPEFLIDGFLVKESIAMLAGPVAQRKSIIALNIAHALCTGDPLFGFFEVLAKPERIIYLCPEMGAASFVKRIEQMGLGPYIGETLFIQTMSESATKLDELEGELPGSVVLLDTITRFVDGDENSSADMRVFAQKVFRCRNAGASLVLLHHSKKGSSGTLDDGLRGSSELAAFVDSCWVTELEDPKQPYLSLSKVRNVKQRDFESNPFKLAPAPGSFVLSIQGEPASEVELKSKAETAALGVLRKLLEANPKMGISKLGAAMRKAGHGKGQPWVIENRKALLESTSGATLTSG